MDGLWEIILEAEYPENVVGLYPVTEGVQDDPNALERIGSHAPA